MATATRQIRCKVCRNLLPVTLFNTPEPAPCPVCGVNTLVVAFPALVRDSSAEVGGERIVDSADAGCFYHPGKRAAVVCDVCGRFLCSLCSVEFDDKHMCPACLEKGRKKGKLSKLDKQRTRYDDLAVALAVLPLLLVWVVWVTVITAPVTLFICVRYWKTPCSVIPRTRFRFIFAAVLASLQIAGWIVLFCDMFGF